MITSTSGHKINRLRVSNVPEKEEEYKYSYRISNDNRSKKEKHKNKNERCKLENNVTAILSSGKEIPAIFQNTDQVQD